MQFVRSIESEWFITMQNRSYVGGTPKFYCRKNMDEEYGPLSILIW